MKSLTTNDKPALVLVALQKGFDEVPYAGSLRNNPEAESNASKLLHIWRSKGLPLIHVQHTSANPDSPMKKGMKGHEFKDEVRPLDGEYVISQNLDNTIASETLRKKLEEEKIKKVVIVGMSTDRCISYTVHLVSTYGYEAIVVYDATATFGKPNPRIQEQMYSAELIHDIAIASLKDEFASVTMTDELIHALRQN